MILKLSILILVVLVIIIIYYQYRIQKKLPKLYYINLEHRKDRKTHILRQLKKIDYPQSHIHRIDAIKHDNGATGCGLSHIKALELAQKNHKNKRDYIIILEDDFTWIHDKNQTLKTLTHALNVSDWNVILLACNGTTSGADNKYVRKVNKCQTTSGYIIRIGYIPKLLKIWKKDMLHRQYTKKYIPDTCIDMSWKKIQHEDWYITNPKLGYQMESYSDIENRKVNYHV